MSNVHSEISDNKTHRLMVLPNFGLSPKSTQAVVNDEPNLFEMNSHSVHPVMTNKRVEII